MAHGTFQLSTTNPNDTTGGGGCICSELHDPDTRGPYVVAYATDMDSSVSPHVVICAECVKEILKLISEDQPLQVGIPGDEPGVNDPYAGDEGDDVLRQRRTRAEQGPLLSGTEDVTAADEDEDDIEPLI